MVGPIKWNCYNILTEELGKNRSYRDNLYNYFFNNFTTLGTVNMKINAFDNSCKSVNPKPFISEA